MATTNEHPAEERKERPPRDFLLRLADSYEGSAAALGLLRGDHRAAVRLLNRYGERARADAEQAPQEPAERPAA